MNLPAFFITLALLQYNKNMIIPYITALFQYRQTRLKKNSEVVVVGVIVVVVVVVVVWDYCCSLWQRSHCIIISLPLDPRVSTYSILPQLCENGIAVGYGDIHLKVLLAPS